ncbi:tetratricopeptide repeat protein [Spirulina sp. 06S082]|uniref:tetratricopeptide repeat protein n=1 Tax=Spirulina sp. 06S082 TaxID=3110248 RepID=UPI002B1EA4CF|nr:tetratricopeptide repeat protein [Spirulina sp. 06S082]MEA5471756.1 tetratricopeptide repeat protein [Spirulina sp. 06S082]
METSIEVSSSNFAADVIAKSEDKLVVVDFFATWCGPCQILKPILASLSREYDFILATIDIDKNPDLASQFAVTGVPDIRICDRGQMHSGFVGVLPEPQLRELLAQYNLKSDLELGIEEAKSAIAAGNAKAAKQIFDRLFSQFPNSPLVTIQAARFLIHLNKLDKAQELLDSVGFENQDHFNKAQSFKALIGFKQVLDKPENTKLGQKYARACQLALRENYEDSLKLLLEVVEADRKYNDDGARKAMTSIFAILGTQHPLTKKYQPELMMTLY